jgi:hypothetical protein
MNLALKQYVHPGFVMWLYIIKNFDCADKMLRSLAHLLSHLPFSCCLQHPRPFFFALSTSSSSS